MKFCLGVFGFRFLFVAIVTRVLRCVGFVVCLDYEFMIDLNAFLYWLGFDLWFFARRCVNLWPVLIVNWTHFGFGASLFCLGETIGLSQLCLLPQHLCISYAVDYGFNWFFFVFMLTCYKKRRNKKFDLLTHVNYNKTRRKFDLSINKAFS